MLSESARRENSGTPEHKSPHLQTHRARFHACCSTSNRSHPPLLHWRTRQAAGPYLRVYGDGLVLSKALSRSTVDMLILDWHSTGLCGLDLLKSVRSSFGERVPVLFVTADGAEHNIVRALTAGADDFLVHPVRAAEFGARVEALLRRAYPRQTSDEPGSRLLSLRRAPADRHRARQAGATERHAIPPRDAVLLERWPRAFARSHFRDGLGPRVPRNHAYDRQPRVTPAPRAGNRASESFPAAACLQERIPACFICMATKAGETEHESDGDRRLTTETENAVARRHFFDRTPHV